MAIYTFTVKKTGSVDWTIFAADGRVMHVLNRCSDAYDAKMRAQAWASSFHAVEVEVIDEQDRPRDKMPSKT
jgi:hypothetical protein